MTSVVGNLAVQNSDGSFNLGDFYNVSPKNNEKVYNSSESLNNAFLINTFDGISITDTFNADIADQDQILST
ncbi:hypothetical protein COM13_28080 [Bacillus pseudomycoides]|uniref:spore germination protein n=1 Tax=Bacillus pseudomycoides TaxID=64104 RepID=UPI000BEFF0DD|nr:spore germination protein [Bacillus pseudomycoides]PEM35479.1 hypothetical protein CN634_24720 [Bacillus pseudomycoides]PGB77016.1 hypothetical protein COM13_28080 [Bacillus pseudomycoides]